MACRPRKGRHASLAEAALHQLAAPGLSPPASPAGSAQRSGSSFRAAEGSQHQDDDDDEDVSMEGDLLARQPAAQKDTATSHPKAGAQGTHPLPMMRFLWPDLKQRHAVCMLTCCTLSRSVSQQMLKQQYGSAADAHAPASSINSCLTSTRASGKLASIACMMFDVNGGDACRRPC